ncbi:uncharacterized protein LOC108903432 isoform X2 [Anoplophora glabripennis]|uniref:uncharacterized protein LOC108903432 isoform X2 n=1 Tax=Anoplophora glabripennis TaxID=217634 RepID=UPI0008742A14|nr:uncharacterized protein LOC108903432 isoform X2 [Anoplophora glabripennis]
MASKVIMKIPVAPFGQVNKSKSGNVIAGEIVVPRSQDVSPRPAETPKGPENVRIAQLEQNIKFLQEQHHLMLTGLHKEIESLKSRNRELQFQLVFVKGTLPSSGSPSSPEDDAKHKVYSSPKPFNITPLQVEILEKELSDLKLQLQETESRNLYLSAIVDEQKKKLERYERDREKERERAIQPDPELLRKLDDAEAIIRRLRRENSDLRRENCLTTAHYQQPREPPAQRENGYTSPRSGQNQGRGNSGGRHRSNNGGHYRGNWFPPLHSQSYWQGGRNNERNGLPVDGQNVLPNLQPGEGPNGTQYQGRRGTNNNHYHNGDGRKYRGGQKNHKPT